MITKINENAIQQDEEDKLLLRGAQIRRERAKTGMSQITMSKKLGINVKVLDAIELGSKSMLSCDVVLKCIKEKIFPIPDSENGIKCGVCESCNASYIRPTNDLKKCKSCIEKEKRPAQKAEVKPVQNDNTIKGTFNDFSNIINALFRLLPNSEQQKVIDKLIDAVDASPSKR